MKDCDGELGITGIGEKLLLLVSRSCTEGTGVSKGVSIWLDRTEAGSTEGVWMNGTGFPACDKSTQPPRKDKKLVRVIQSRRLIFNDFIDDTLIIKARSITPAARDHDISILVKADNAPLFERGQELLV